MTTTQNKIRKQERIIDDAKTMHILHFLLSLFTGFLWAIVWILVGLYNHSKRISALDEIDRLTRLEHLSHSS